MFRFQFEGNVRYWSDYLKVNFHAKSIFQAPGMAMGMGVAMGMALGRLLVLLTFLLFCVFGSLCVLVVAAWWW